jgi:CheY-like chemotaxis protein
MSHELRTPLNAVLGFAQLLAMEELGATQKQSIDQILKGGQHLLGLINEVLEISRIESGRLTLSVEPVEVGETANEVLDLVRPIASDRRIRLSFVPPADELCVQADRQRLKQVLLNLLSNAVKYNCDGGEVHLNVHRSDGTVRLEVVDSGPGIPPDRVHRLFTPFDRLGADQTEIEGTGLGLALSKGLVEAMGGTIGVENQPEKGSTFWIELTRAESPLERLAHHQASPLALSTLPTKEPLRTVLYVEDNVSNQKLVERVLAHRPGIRLLTALQGSLGLELAQNHRPDLVLLDLHLPDGSGEEVLARLRDDPATSDIPIVVLSADATRGRIARLLEEGADAYLTKPLDVQRFLEVLDEKLPEPAKVR